MQAYFLLVWSIAMSFLRRWLGGGFDEILGNLSRIWKNITYVLILVLMYITSGNIPKSWTGLAMMVWVIAWMIRYFNHTHGDYFGLTGEEPDEERSWWVGKVLKAIYGKGKYYNFIGNLTGLTLGYLVPALLASIFMPSHWFWVAGFTTPLGYVFCQICLGKYGKNEYAEWLNGFTVGAIFYLNLI